MLKLQSKMRGGRGKKVKAQDREAKQEREGESEKQRVARTNARQGGTVQSHRQLLTLPQAYSIPQPAKNTSTEHHYTV